MRPIKLSVEGKPVGGAAVLPSGVNFRIETIGFKFQRTLSPLALESQAPIWNGTVHRIGPCLRAQGFGDAVFGSSVDGRRSLLSKTAIYAFGVM